MLKRTWTLAVVAVAAALSLGASSAHAQVKLSTTTRATSTTGLNDSALTLVTDSATRSRTATVAQLRKALSVKPFDSVSTTKLTLSGAVITGAPTWSSGQTFPNLTVSGSSSLQATSVGGSDASYNFRVNGNGTTSNRIRMYNSTSATVIDAANAGETALAPLQLNGSTVQIAQSGSTIIGPADPGGSQTLRVDGTALVSSTLTAAKLNSSRGTLATTSGTAITVFTPPGEGTYLVGVTNDGGGTTVNCAGIVSADNGGNAILLTQWCGASASLSLSGATVKFTQSSGFALNETWTYTLLF